MLVGIGCGQSFLKARVTEGMTQWVAANGQGDGELGNRNREGSYCSVVIAKDKLRGGCRKCTCISFGVRAACYCACLVG